MPQVPVSYTIEQAQPKADLPSAQLEWIHALNQFYADKLSSETLQDMKTIYTGAFFAALAQPRAGFLICYDETGDYESPNFDWMQARYDRFCYVDRIAVAEAFYGKGVARGLYEAAMTCARASGHTNFVCEVNIEPMNHGSMAFHEKLGFKRIGEATHKAPLYGPTDKTVAYLHCTL